MISIKFKSNALFRRFCMYNLVLSSPRIPAQRIATNTISMYDKKIHFTLCSLCSRHFHTQIHNCINMFNNQKMSNSFHSCITFSLYSSLSCRVHQSTSSATSSFPLETKRRRCLCCSCCCCCHCRRHNSIK